MVNINANISPVDTVEDVEYAGLENVQIAAVQSGLTFSSPMFYTAAIFTIQNLSLIHI